MLSREKVPEGPSVFHEGCPATVWQNTSLVSILCAFTQLDLTARRCTECYAIATALALVWELSFGRVAQFYVTEVSCSAALSLALELIKN